MKRFEFNVLLRVNNFPCTKGFVVYANDLTMARGILRGQAAIMGWQVLDIR